VPLVEIITAPDFSTSEEVVDWLKKLLHNLDYLKCVDSNAGIKVDVNVSIPGKSERVEIKNVSSLESIGKAVNYELERQAREGGKVKETRRYDDLKGTTCVMRTKEGHADYRFISDPDLAEIVLSDEFVKDAEKKVPEAPEIKLDKLIKEHKIDKKNAEILAKNIDIAEFFERVAERIDAQFALPWVTVELLRFLNYNNKKLNEVKIDVEHFVVLLRLVKEDKITPLKGKEILNKFYPESFAPSSENEGKISDPIELEGIAKEIINKNPKAAEDYKKGEQKSFDFLMGQIMVATKKRADFKIAREVLGKLLK